MPIYRGTTPLKAYKGDMQPVNVYRGATKVAGWHSASYSGTSPLTVDCDYDVPPDALTITGMCVQTGTPSPDSPAPISTITGNVGITGADGASSDTATVAFGSAVCASLPDGTHDSYDAVTGVLAKRVGKVVFVGSVPCRVNNSKIAGQTEFAIDGTSSVAFSVAVSDRFLCVTSFDAGGIGKFRVAASAIVLKIENSRIGVLDTDTDAVKIAAFKSWLAANPVTVYYKLATPTTVQLTPHLPVVRTGIKTLTVGADVVPTLSATVKSMESAITSITQG